ncbi:hypothetical protein HYPSUDRAFT_56496 [Hypholoma sublateritium FD-334 SS-4]|uniref:Uncharacterized protein n=1 Tax=Hypholoma sublateritium (strain FD-334 SS-4) TaxID=945553 RepID=A0A0D2NSN9_HYPSF|nr:hypothetical protein HYPSUDRAFT_56496 [Hypholoma sublateritium FD-334 SS-4]
MDLFFHSAQHSADALDEAFKRTHCPPHPPELPARQTPAPLAHHVPTVMVQDAVSVVHTKVRIQVMFKAMAGGAGICVAVARISIAHELFGCDQPHKERQYLAARYIEIQGVKRPSDPHPAFRDFMKHEKQRPTQKYQAHVKSDMDKGMADLVKFSQNSKLNNPIADGLVPILAKDEGRQRQIMEKAIAEARSICMSMRRKLVRSDINHSTGCHAAEVSAAVAATSNVSNDRNTLRRPASEQLFVPTQATCDRGIDVNVAVAAAAYPDVAVSGVERVADEPGGAHIRRHRQRLRIRTSQHCIKRRPVRGRSRS